MTTSEIYSKCLLKEILASIPNEFEKELIMREGEPTMLQLLKLSILAFYNNILRCPFMERHGNNLLKALWLLKNIECASKVFKQYNYMQLYPFINDTRTEYLLPFMTNMMLPDNVVHEWNTMQELIPIILAAIQSLRNTIPLQRLDLLKAFQKLSIEESKITETMQNLAVNLMLETGEYNSSIDNFIDIFMPVDRFDVGDTTDGGQENAPDLSLMDEPIFSEKSICMLHQMVNGENIVNHLPSL